MKIREDLIKEIIRNKTVLDMGSSWGDFGKLIKNSCREYYSLDIEKGADYIIDLNKPFDLNKKFDVIIAGELIEHIENTGIFLASVRKHLKPNGVFFLSTPNPTSLRFFVYMFVNKEPKFEGHIKYFTKDSLQLVLKKYFRHIDVGFEAYVSNTPNRDSLSWKIKFKTECIVGDIIPRLSPDLYAICRK